MPNTSIHIASAPVESALSDSVLSIEAYSLSYATALGPMRVLDGINLQIQRGQVLGLVGESGSGKSSLAYAIMRGLPGRIAAEQGIIRFNHQEIQTLDDAAMQSLRGDRIAMVFQNAATALNPTQTLGEHVVEVLRTHRGVATDTARARARVLFEQVGLADPDGMLDRYAHQISGGEKQRVVLATAFACDPDLILFDEPTSALDATTAATLLDLFRELQSNTGVAALFISHDLAVISSIAHRVAVIYGGRIVEYNKTDELFRTPRHPYTRALLTNLPKPTHRGLQPLVMLTGPAPDRLGQVPACTFSDRCSFVTDECLVGSIRLRPVVEDLASIGEEGQAQVACLHWQAVINRALTTELADGRDSVIVDNSPILEAESISVRFKHKSDWRRYFGRKADAVYAVNNVSFTLLKGETLGLVGESGCGKSSLARALVSLHDYSGKVVVDGIAVINTVSENADNQHKIQIIFQNPDSSLNPRHKIGLLLERPLKLYQNELDADARQNAIKDLLRRVQLPTDYANRYPHELSGGEKQRVAIARAIAAGPAVIICDEITSGLDVSVQSAIIKLLRDIQLDTGVALLFITHDLNVLRQMAHRVAVMYLGEIVEGRPVSGLSNPPYHPYTEALLSSVPVVDPEVETRRVRLSGTLPKRTSETVGCPFASRCARLIDERCRTERPPIRLFASGVSIACHLSDHDLMQIPSIWRMPDSSQESPA